jgi:hypothetical protein
VKPKTGKYSVKDYRCGKCQEVFETGTNHWGEIYTGCRSCGRGTVSQCLEACPDTHVLPEKWKMVKLEDICVTIPRSST